MLYAFLKIADIFFIHLWPYVSSHTRFRPRVKESYVVCCYIPWILQAPQEKISRDKIARS